MILVVLGGVLLLLGSLGTVWRVKARWRNLSGLSAIPARSRADRAKPEDLPFHHLLRVRDVVTVLGGSNAVLEGGVIHRKTSLLLGLRLLLNSVLIRNLPLVQELVNRGGERWSDFLFDEVRRKLNSPCHLPGHRP